MKDLAGGIVVPHYCGCGCSGYMCDGRTKTGFPERNFVAHNLPMCFTGAGLLWTAGLVSMREVD